MGVRYIINNNINMMRKQGIAADQSRQIHEDKYYHIPY